MPRIKPGPPCTICGEPSQGRDLCNKHYQRWWRHGHADQTRPDDWGKRRKHPLYGVWRWIRRNPHVSEWDDFYVFLADVGEKPPEADKLRRRDTTSPYGPENCYWAEKLGPATNHKERAAYARKWRKNNPRRSKANDLKRSFGITLEEYGEMLEQQDGGCAICGQKDEWFSLAVDHCHEKGHIRGLLCSLCNRGLGMFKDSPENLKGALEYLLKDRTI